MGCFCVYDLQVTTNNHLLVFMNVIHLIKTNNLKQQDTWFQIVCSFVGQYRGYFCYKHVYTRQRIQQLGFIVPILTLATSTSCGLMASSLAWIASCSNRVQTPRFKHCQSSYQHDQPYKLTFTKWHHKTNPPHVSTSVNNNHFENNTCSRLEMYKPSPFYLLSSNMRTKRKASENQSVALCGYDAHDTPNMVQTPHQPPTWTHDMQATHEDTTPHAALCTISTWHAKQETPKSTSNLSLSTTYTPLHWRDSWVIHGTPTFKVPTLIKKKT